MFEIDTVKFAFKLILINSIFNWKLNLVQMAPNSRYFTHFLPEIV